MKKISVAGIELDIDIRGNGPSMLYLHPEHYAHLHEPLINKLAEYWRVFVPLTLVSTDAGLLHNSKCW